MKEKLKTLIGELNQGLVERDEAIKLALLTLLAGENLVLIGPPGTGKSMVARRIADCFKDSAYNNLKTEKINDYFEYLLTKFSTPEEIFGPLSIKALKADTFKRNTDGYLPSVRVAFLDEIFKASSSILNALLTILNERIFHNGCQAIEVPLQGLIAASNELPTGQEELSALYDRFLVRCFVDYVQQKNIKHLFDAAAESCVSTRLTSEDLHTIQTLAKAVVIPQSIRDIIQKIWLEHRELFKEDRRESLSDRRLRKVLNLLRVSAATNDRSEVDLSDVLLLKDCLWNHKDNADKVKTLITTILGQHRYQSSNQNPLVDEVLPSEDEVVISISQTVKGYRGKGTKEDPLLIENLDQLIGMIRPEIGLQGYYFKQLVDIDASKLTSWPTIRFKGNYDGGSQTISGPNGNNALFSVLEPTSTVIQINLKNLSLASDAFGSFISSCSTDQILLMSNVVDCEITQCNADKSLVGKRVERCSVSNCITGLSLIGGDVYECVIKQCQTGSILVDNGERFPRAITKSSISDCLVSFKLTGFDYKFGKGGIVNSIYDQSLIQRCFVVGQFDALYSDLMFWGVAEKCEDSAVENCCIGYLENLSSTNSVYVSNFIVNELKGVGSLKNNAAIDPPSGCSFNTINEPDGKNGMKLSGTIFSLYFLEHVLNWDFENIWYWDETKNLPLLRDVGVMAAVKPSLTQKEEIKVDVLREQVKTNLWLLGA